MRHHDNNNRQLVRIEMERQRVFPLEFRALLAVAVLLLASLILLATARQLFGALDVSPAYESPDNAKLRRYQQQLNTLKENMAAAVSGSVETRMRRLEQIVASGTVGSQEIQALEDLSRDLHVLENYTSGGSGHVMDAERLMHPRLRPQTAVLSDAGADASNDIARKLAQVKHLLYFGFASCGMALVLVGGYWWKNVIFVRRLRLEADTRKQVGFAPAE